MNNSHRTERPHSLSVITRLCDEWTQLAHRRSALQRANQWHLPGGPVESLDVILERCGFDQAGNHEHHDAYLSDLTRLAREDDLAARIVLQRIVPGLVSIAVRRAPITANGLPGAFDLVVSAAWLVIRQFPIERRSRRVAANLLMDIEYLAFVRDTRLKSHRNEDARQPTSMLGIESGRFHAGDCTFDPVGDSAALEILLHSFERNGLADKDLQMLRAVSQDINSVEAAAVLGLSARSVRNRRENALVRARAVLTEESRQRSGISS